MSIVIAILKWIIANPKVISLVMATPELKSLFVRIGVEAYFELKSDPQFRSALVVLEKTLEDPDLTVEERQNVCTQIAALHPKS